MKSWRGEDEARVIRTEDLRWWLCRLIGCRWQPLHGEPFSHFAECRRCHSKGVRRILGA